MVTPVRPWWTFHIATGFLVVPVLFVAVVVFVVVVVVVVVCVVVVVVVVARSCFGCLPFHAWSTSPTQKLG